MSDIDISTHDLTKRSTMEQYQKSFIMEHFNSRPHEEVDLKVFETPSIRGLFQLTTSRRGRRFSMTKRAELVVISTHDLTKRSTRKDGLIDSVRLLFQLTTSRRGRRQFLRKKFSFPNYFLCLLHIIYSYYINTIFFSTLFFAKSSFFLVRIP